jgi:tetratricopeptide (TPR) repeat protein
VRAFRRFSWAGALAAGALLVSSAALGHDLITPEAAERYVAQAQQNVAIVASRDPAPRRAEANVALGRDLDEIRELLNRDLASHGKVQGLPSNLLIARLKAVGAPLSWSDSLGRYAAAVGYYQAALELDPNGRLANDAIYGYLYGTFYDGFRDDPLQPLTRDAALLRTQLDLGERFIREFPRDRNLEEVKFITAVLYVRAARAGGTDASRSAARARELLRQFERDYPNSMRTAAVPVLLDALR